MKILVTGASGFIGSHVVDQLLQTEHDVIATSIDNIDDVSKKFRWLDKVKYVQKDLDDREENYYKYFDEPDLVIHLSWAGLPNYYELFHIERNLMSLISR